MKTLDIAVNASRIWHILEGTYSITTNQVKKLLSLSDKDFFAAIGYGGVQLSKVMQRLKSEYNKKYGEKAQPDTSDLENKIKTSKNSTGVIVDGIDNCAIKFAQCCNPLPGDEIVGFITRGHGISVHKKDCVNYLSQKDDPENAARWINVKWESSEKHTGYFKCTLDIVAVDRIGLLADVSSALAMINIFIYESTSRELKNGNAMLSVTVSNLVRNRWIGMGVVLLFWFFSISGKATQFLKNWGPFSYGTCDFGKLTEWRWLGGKVLCVVFAGMMLAFVPKILKKRG